MYFIMWFDDNKRHTTADKINDAANAYCLRFGMRPNVALVLKGEDGTQVEGIDVRPYAGITSSNIVWVGHE